MSKLPKSIITGRVGEQYSRSVVLDVSDELKLFPGTVPSLVYKRPEEETIYPGTISFDSDTGIITWLIDSVITGIQGSDGAVQILFTKSDDVHTIIGQSFIIRLVVLESLTEDEGEPPDPYDSWIASLTALGSQTLANANAAAASALMAESSASAAASSASSVSEIAGDVSDIADDIQTIAGQVESAKNAAVAAKDDAVSAKNNANNAAELSRQSASSSSSYASSAHTDAVIAQNAADDVRDTIDIIRSYSESANNSAADADSSARAALDARDKILALGVKASTVNTGIATARFELINNILTLLLEIPRGEKGEQGDVSIDQFNALIAALKSGSQEDADYHLGFFINDNGYLCQIVEEE